jgi:hypothetical protein
MTDLYPARPAAGLAPPAGVTVIVTPARQPEVAAGQDRGGGPGQPESREDAMSLRRGRSRQRGDTARDDTARDDTARDDTAGSAADRGSLTLMLAVLFVALLALAGVVIDGGAKLTAAENAAAIAQEAARAGAGMVNEADAHENGSFVVDEDQAVAAADAYLSGAGYAGRATAGPGIDEIQVMVRVSQPTKVLSIIGIDTIRATGRATANLVSGVTGPGQ